MVVPEWNKRSLKVQIRMFGTAFQKKRSKLIGKAPLITMKMRALRAGVWFKAFNGKDQSACRLNDNGCGLRAEHDLSQEP